MTGDSNNKKRTRAHEDAEKRVAEAASKREMLDRLKWSSDDLKIKAAGKIVFLPAWVTLGDVPIISRGTINLIQGKAGAHKSRFAETLAGLLLSDGRKDFLGFKRYRGSEGYCVAYVDTERNCLEDFPAAIQRIRTAAGYRPTEDTPNFYPVSIKQETREDRLTAVRTWIDHVQDDMYNRGVGDWNLFVVLDVVTDCARSFNNDSDSLLLFDYIGNLCEDTGAAFLLLLHENPGTEKARGHIGTEGLNKANTQIQIGYERKENGEDTELIKVKFLKTRNAAKPEPLYFQFSRTEGGLVAADKERVREVLAEKTKAGNIEIAAEAMERVMAGRGEITKQDILTLLAAEAGISERTAERRVNDLISTGYTLRDDQGRACVLIATRATGRATTYTLQPSNEGKGSDKDGDLPF